MSAKANYFKIGIFVMATLAVGVAAVVILGAGTFFRKEILAETYVDESVQGLEVGAAVRYRGVKLGRVKEISFCHNRYAEAVATRTSARYVLVRFTISPDTFRGQRTESLASILQTEIEENGLRCRLGSLGITGMLYVEVDYVDNPEDLPESEISWSPESGIYYIPSAPSTITRLSEGIEGIMSKLEQVLTKLDALSLEPIIRDLQELVRSLTAQVSAAELGGVRDEVLKILTATRQTSEEFQRLITRPEIEKILSGAADTVVSARSVMENSEKKVTELLDGLMALSENINATAEKVDGILSEDDIPEAARHLNSTLRRLEKTVSRQQLNVEAILENLRGITDDLKEFSRNAKDNPAGVIFSDPPPPTKLEEKK